MKSMKAVKKENSRTRLSPLGAGLLILSGLAPSLVAGAEASSDLSVQIDGDVVTVSADNAPLQLIIDEIVVQGGLQLVQHAALDRDVSIHVERMPLPEFLNDLLRQDSYQLFVAPPGDDEAHELQPVPGTLWIFAEGAAATPVTTVFLEAVLYFGSLAEKKEAIRELKRLGSAAAIQSLSLAMNDDDPYISDAALAALSAIGSDEALAAIASTSLDSDPWVRSESINALSSGNADTAMQYLNLAMADPDPRVRMSVIDAYADIPSEYAAQAISLALADPDEKVRERALDALDEVKATIAFDALMQMRSAED